MSIHFIHLLRVERQPPVYRLARKMLSQLFTVHLNTPWFDALYAPAFIAARLPVPLLEKIAMMPNPT